MAKKILKTPAKISVRIWRPIIQKLDAKLEAACLRRDAYLTRVLETEIEWLDQEVSLPNSQASYDYVFERLDRLDRKLVSLALPAAVTSRLNEICSRKRIVRDAFFNRLFLLLAASPKVVDTLLFGPGREDWRRDVWSECKHDGPFFQNGFYPLEPMIDPFWAVRTGLSMHADNLEDYVEPLSGRTVSVSRDAITGVIAPADSLYTTVFGHKIGDNDLLGLSCYIPDWRVPGQPAELDHRTKLDELFAEL